MAVDPVRILHTIVAVTAQLHQKIPLIGGDGADRQAVGRRLAVCAIEGADFLLRGDRRQGVVSRSGRGELPGRPAFAAVGFFFLLRRSGAAGSQRNQQKKGRQKSKRFFMVSHILSLRA